MNKKRFADSLLKPLGFELVRTREHEEKPWDHTFREGIEAERAGGDPNAPVAEAWGNPEWSPYIEPHVRDNMVVCEVGPGLGRWTHYVIDHSERLYMVDYSKLVCDYWAGKGDPRIVAVNSQNTRIPAVPSGSVDLFMSFDVFVHMDIEVVYGYMQEAFRVLKPGAVALIDYLAIRDEESAKWFADELAKQEVYSAPDAVERSIFRIQHPDTIRTLAEGLGFGFENTQDKWPMHYICTLTKPAD